MMLKKIPVEKLRAGMYVHKLDCRWMHHPFLRNCLALTTEIEVRKIVAAGIEAVYIDTERGEDVMEEVLVEQALAGTDTRQASGPTAPKRRRCAADERAYARRLHAEAYAAIRGAMEDARLGRRVHLQQVELVVERVTESILRNRNAIFALCRMRRKDDYTFMHSVSVGALLIAFCHELGVDAQTAHQAGIGGMLHDIGKIRIPDAILNKPARLTAEEFVVMKRHVEESRRILEAAPGISEAAIEVAVLHHERYDGSGYAQGLRAEQISVIGQMAAICDVYDAITSERVYHKAMAPTEALGKLFEWSESLFDAQLVRAFIGCVGIYPVGTLVLLESGRLALVLDQHEDDLLQPLVRIIFHSRANRYLLPEDLDLSRASTADRILRHEDPAKWGIDPARFL